MKHLLLKSSPDPTLTSCMTSGNLVFHFIFFFGKMRVNNTTAHKIVLRIKGAKTKPHRLLRTVPGTS